MSWLSKPKYFYSFFTLVWVVVQIASGNIFQTFSQVDTTPDVYSYVTSAELIINGGYPWFRAVGYPILLAPFLALGGLKLTIVTFTIIQTIAWLLTVRLVYSILNQFNVPLNWSLAGASLYAFGISAILTTNYLLTETLYTFLLVLSSYLFTQWVVKKETKNIHWIFIVLVISSLIRPLGLNFFYLSFLIVLVELIRKRIKSVVFFIIAGIMLLTHLFLMKHHHNTFQICMSKNHALYHYLFMKVSKYPNMNVSSYEKEFFKESAQLDSAIGEREFFFSYRDSIYAERNINLFKSKKYATFKTMYVNFKDEINQGYSNNSFDYTWVYKVTKWQHIHMILLIPFCFLSFIWLAFEGNFFSRKLLAMGSYAVITLYICLGSSLVFWYGDRLHLPFYPLMIILTLLCLHRGKELIKQKSKNKSLATNK